ncbi:uncharacterized protein VICG_01481 [Vittaforma corneae ATCC 50505]|uniref:Uncharacterized protein n=1 Tax=Vittaforma corneae (strain ATCC 50505) TaxID=993615 RepID=L2GMH3_VITCO|nr:uncharacterized protein VICG_01481 [Vittaforma corneae ATCC 50505]ELA41497.1 hypothetical protein VICG_01481 [Vittaforma corneae ATCC 50505]
MKCEVCGTSYKKIDSLLVCANGHTLQNTTEVAHDDNPLRGRSKRIYKPKKEKKVVFKSDGCKLMRMVLMRLLFEESMAYFGIKDNVVFRYFTEFLEFKNAKLDTVFDISKFTLSILVYFAKRSEMERNGQIYLYNEFKDTFNSLDLTNRLIGIKAKFPMLEVAINEFTHNYLITSTICSFRPWIDEFSSLYIYARRYGFVKSSETGILEECVESAKHNIRRLFRNDLELMKVYFPDDMQPSGSGGYSRTRVLF